MWVQRVWGRPKEMEEKVEKGRLFMGQEAGERIGEVKIKTYIEKNDGTLLRLEKATIRTCTVPEDEVKSRMCTELGKLEGRVCEELVLVYRPSGCVREKNEVDLNDETTVTAASIERTKGQKD
jgi:hypothetical protein